MADMTDEEIDRKINNWLRDNDKRWHEWDETVRMSPGTVVNDQILHAMRLAFRAGVLEGSQPKWTPVSDRMPEQDGHTGHVLVVRCGLCDPYFGDRDVTMAFHSPSSVSPSGLWRDDHGSVELYGAKVTHWMPFPDLPPEGK